MPSSEGVPGIRFRSRFSPLLAKLRRSRDHPLPLVVVLAPVEVVAHSRRPELLAEFARALWTEAIAHGRDDDPLHRTLEITGYPENYCSD